MHTKPEFQSSRSEENQWRREAHCAKSLPALGIIIDIGPALVPSVIARQASTPEQFQSSQSEEVKPMMRPTEQLVNRRVMREALEIHHARRNQVIELRALRAANEALEPMHRSWTMRLWRAVRGLLR